MVNVKGSLPGRVSPLIGIKTSTFLCVDRVSVLRPFDHE